MCKWKLKRVSGKEATWEVSKKVLGFWFYDSFIYSDKSDKEVQEIFKKTYINRKEYYYDC